MIDGVALFPKDAKGPTRAAVVATIRTLNLF